MSTNRTTREDRFAFLGATELVASGSVSPIPWRKTLVAGGTAGNVAGGMQLALTSTSEAQSARLSFADILTYDIDDLESIEFLVKLTSAAFTNTSMIIGVASAGNATINTIAEQASFGINGSLALFCETDDGTTDNDDEATGITLVSGSWTRLVIDFATGVKTISPGPSKGGKADVRFSAGQYLSTTSNAAMRRVCQNKNFDMSAYAAGLQPYVQLQKASSADVATLLVAEICVKTRLF
jgi:hypothetical protein